MIRMIRMMMIIIIILIIMFNKKIENISDLFGLSPPTLDQYLT
jgi:hypothetical protein